MKPSIETAIVSQIKIAALVKRLVRAAKPLRRCQLDQPVDSFFANENDLFVISSHVLFRVIHRCRTYGGNWMEVFVKLDLFDVKSIANSSSVPYHLNLASQKLNGMGNGRDLLYEFFRD